MRTSIPTSHQVSLWIRCLPMLCLPFKGLLQKKSFCGRFSLSVFAFFSPPKYTIHLKKMETFVTVIYHPEKKKQQLLHICHRQHKDVLSFVNLPTLPMVYLPFKVTQSEKTFNRAWNLCLSM